MECARRVSHPSIKNDSSAIWRSRGRCRFKEQPRQLFESLGDSRRGCDLLAGQARVFPLDIGIRAKHTSTKCINLSKGARATSIDGSGTRWFFELASLL